MLTGIKTSDPFRSGWFTLKSGATIKGKHSYQPKDILIANCTTNKCPSKLILLRCSSVGVLIDIIGVIKWDFLDKLNLESNHLGVDNAVVSICVVVGN